MFVDETGLSVGRKNHWIRVCCAGGITLKRLHQKRGKEAIEPIHIIPSYGAIIVHDCRESYLSYDHCSLRSWIVQCVFVTSVNIVGGSQPVCLGEKYEKTTAKARHEVSQSDGKCLDSIVYKELQKHYRNLWVRSEKEMPGILPKAAGSRDKTGKSDVHNLLERLRKYESTVLLFARNPQLAFTNNRSERNCMAKSK
ncbi:hypothetical protein [Nitrosomonas sp. Nm51]|uniref:hypothetical protein n=1 Tax=Nitrosomonas sp. Nm51 TaxID=133720 RepID=UPI000B81173C